MTSYPSPFIADPALLEALEQRSIPVPCLVNRTLFKQGDECAGLYIVHTGQANLEMRSDRGQIVAAFKTSDNSLLGLPSALGNQPYSLTAIALKGARISFITRSQTIAMLTSNPELSLKALEILAAETRAARAQFMSFREASGRRR